MRKTILLFVAFLSLFCLPSCSEKFDIAAPYKDITVVYGLLQRTDTAHYIRIQKAYLDNTKSALTMAKEPDSNFYNNLEVRMARLNMTTGKQVDYVVLNKVDLNTEGYTKPEGIFFNTPNYAYKFTNDLDPRYIYQLQVINKATGRVDTGNAPVIDDKTKDYFYVDMIDDSSSLSNFIDFASTNPNSYATITGRYKTPTDFNFHGYNTPVGLVQAFIRFHWVDSNISTNAKTYHSFDMDLGYAGNNSRFTYNVRNIALQSALKLGMGIAPDNTVRLLDRPELLVYLGTHDFNTYISVQALQGVGLTGSEIQPSYTNLVGKDVLGLFTSRGFRKGDITITDRTIAALITNSTLADVKIKGTVYH
ncbi:MAG: hypothetical protein EBZ77_04340 [Chitinophagia bacterium]|nr:hypothetical protein [Chitinophagia bacterium]